MATSYDFTITRGSTFRGFIIRVLDETTGLVLNITDYLPFAEIRKKSKLDSPLVLNLFPAISNSPGGLVTIPEIADNDTVDLLLGEWPWDFILEDPNGKRTEQLALGTVSIIDKSTQPSF